MSAIDKIRIHNFKAFYTGTEPDEIVLGGKHLLMYGENGSGKSSIYWALYTLFQSETKLTEEVAKYFTPTHDEQLLNFNYLNQRPDFETDADGKITNPIDIGKNAEIEVVLENGTSLKIDKDGMHESVANKVRDLHRHSDFITHRLLVNFYNFRNSKQINLWEVFVRDFFPFLTTNKGKGDYTLWQRLKEIENNPPFNLDEVTGKFKRSRSKSWQTKVKKEIDKFNEDLEYWIGRINIIANEVYRNELKIDDNIKIFLNYKEPLRYDHYKDHVIERNGKKYVRGTGYADFNDPEIILNIQRQNTDSTFSLIHRPQAYLNEAKITQIALSIRFSLLHETIKPPYPGQFLALDDLLISLDMSNRDKVVDAILNIYAKKYKIYFLTHERAFYNMVRSRITIKNLSEDWGIKEMFMNDFISPKKPEIIDDKDYLDVALKHLKAFDLPASANYLRKECESSLKRLLPEHLVKKITDEQTKEKQLEDLISSFLKFYKENLHQNPSDFDKLKVYKDFLLNPLSHDNLQTNYYKDEIYHAYLLLNKMRNLKRFILLNSNEILFSNHSTPAGNFINYEILLKENLSCFKVLSGDLIIANTHCCFIKKTENNISTEMNFDAKLYSIQNSIYKTSMQTGKINEELPNLKDALYNANGETLNQLIFNL